MKLTEKQKIVLSYVNDKKSVHEHLVNKNTTNALYNKGLLECWLSIDGNCWELTDKGIQELKKLKTKSDEN